MKSVEEQSVQNVESEKEGSEDEDYARRSFNFLKELREKAPSYFRLVFEERENPVTWSIVPDENSPFIKLTNPYFIDHQNCIAAALFGKKVSAILLYILKSKAVFLAEFLWYFVAVVSLYGITDLIIDEFIILCGVTSLFRWLHFLLFTNELLGFLFKEEEVYLLLLSSIFATIGLMDAFSFDIRSLWASEFFSLAVYGILHDASKKYETHHLSYRLYLITFSLYLVNCFIVITLLYFGFTDSLRDRRFSVTIDSTNDQENSTVLTFSSLNTTLAFVQGILLYLLKVPYNLLKNQLFIVKVRLFAKKINLAEYRANLEKERLRARQMSQELSAQSESTNENEIDEKVHVYQWRVAPKKNVFIDPEVPYIWDQRQTLARKLFGKGCGAIAFQLLFRSKLVRAYYVIWFVTVLPLFFVTLIGLIPGSVALYSLAGLPAVLLWASLLNFDLFKRLLLTSEAWTIFIFGLIGMFGIMDAFSFDERAPAVFIFALGITVFAVLEDARTRALGYNFHSRVKGYSFLFFGIFLFLLYFGIPVDLRDRTIDLKNVTGKDNAVVVSSINISLFCAEFAFLFGIKNYYSSAVKGGLSILKVKLRFEKVDLSKAYAQPFLHEPRAIQQLIGSTSKSKAQKSTDDPLNTLVPIEAQI